MNNERRAPAARRAELMAECAQQRGDLVRQCQSLEMPFGGGLGGFLGSHKTLMLSVAGVALGLMATRPKRLLSLAAAGLSMWKLVRGMRPLLAKSGTNNQ